MLFSLYFLFLFIHIPCMRCIQVDRIILFSSCTLISNTFPSCSTTPSNETSQNNLVPQKVLPKEIIGIGIQAQSVSINFYPSVDPKYTDTMGGKLKLPTINVVYVLKVKMNLLSK